MIQFGTGAQIFVMHEAISFRLGIDGTAAVARLVLQKEPMSGAYFLFKGKMGHSIRILFYDGGAFWLCTRRLSKGRFRHWPEANELKSVPKCLPERCKF
jgi:transposase